MKFIANILNFHSYLANETQSVVFWLEIKKIVRTIQYDRCDRNTHSESGGGQALTLRNKIITNRQDRGGSEPKKL